MLEYHQSALISIVLLRQVALTAFTIFLIRLSLAAHHIESWVSISISCICVGVHFLEDKILYVVGLVRNKYKQDCGNEAAQNLDVLCHFKIFKAVITIAPFTLNGNINDFFICYFFFVTGVCGSTYFSICGFSLPHANYRVSDFDERYSRLKNPKEYYEKLIKEIELNRRTSHANSVMFVLTVFFMSIGFATYGYSDWFFEGKNVTTLGASAVVMILINAQAWPFMLDTI